MAVGDGNSTGNDRKEPVAQQDEAVTVPEASRRLGRSVDAVRSSLRRGTLRGHKGNDGEWRVRLPVDDRQRSVADGHDDGMSSLAVALRQEIDRLRQELGQARDGMETWRRQAEDGRATIAALREELAGERQRREGVDREAAMAARAVELGRETLHEVRAERDRLLGELREARQPWWRRWGLRASP